MHYCDLAGEGLKPNFNNEDDQADKYEIIEDCPLPSTESVTLWRTFISSCYHHPNLMAHHDVICLRELFQKLGSDVRCENANLLVSLEIADTPVNYLRPVLPQNSICPMFVFATISEVELVSHLNIAIVRKYNFMDNMKASISEMVSFVIAFPEVLLTEQCSFIYNFLVKFGVLVECIDNVISETRTRRAAGISNASVLAPELPQSSPDEKSPQNNKRNPKKQKKIEIPEKLNNNAKSSLTEHNEFDLEESEEEEDDEDGEENEEDEGEGDGDNSQSARRRRMKKPFECPVCHNRFVYKGNANYHIRRKHPGSEQIPVSRKRVPRTEDYVAPYSCPICNTGFVCKSNARTHIKKFHPDSDAVPKAADVNTKENSENFYNQEVNVQFDTEDTTDSISNLLNISDEDSSFVT